MIEQQSSPKPAQRGKSSARRRLRCCNAALVRLVAGCCRVAGRRGGFISWLCGLLLLTGCGTMRDHTATQQLILSDAVDRSVAHIDFSPLRDERVYLDSRYMTDNKPTNLVNSNYIISSLRQQMMMAGCLLQEKPEDADYVVEARVGTLGADGHDVNYGVQGSGALAAAATAISSVPLMPSIPEISLARKTEDAGVAKISLFAYRRETREPVWQSGSSVAISKAQRKWILGAGPFQHGEVYEAAELGEERLVANPFVDNPRHMDDREERYHSMNIFERRLREKVLEDVEFSGSEIERTARRDRASDSTSSPDSATSGTGPRGDGEAVPAAGAPAPSGPPVAPPTGPLLSPPTAQSPVAPPTAPPTPPAAAAQPAAAPGPPLPAGKAESSESAGRVARLPAADPSP